jgi:hypothetical protein
MAFDNRWEALLDPGKATDFFGSAELRPPFDPGASGWGVGQAWWCSEMSRAIYRRDGRAAFFDGVGLREQRFFDAGSTQGALVTGPEFAVLVFRGTANLRDWLTNLRVAPVAWAHGGRVHEGFARALDKVWEDVEAELDRIDVPTFVTGHSLGGALATLAAARRSFVASYTFGAPRVGDEAFWQTLQTTLHRVVNHRDVVPTVPPRRMGYAHGGELHHIAADGSLHDTPAPNTLADLVDQRRWFDPHESLADHAPINYTTHLTQ